MGQNAIPSDAPPGVSACESSEGRDMELIIGPRTYSTWSLRGWLILKHTGADFGVIDVRYDTKAQKAALRDLSPSGFVPVLRVDGEMIWDTLAIGEWAAEHYPQARMWPADPVGDARSETPSDPVLDRDLARIVALFRQMRRRFGGDGPWLFGDWSIADAFFTPVAARVRHFQIDLADHGDDGVAAAYVQSLLAHPDFRLWETEALT
jgi:glutathione S-transferase